MKTYLYVPFEEKDFVKKLGAKWDKENRSWYILDDNKKRDEILLNWKTNKKLTMELKYIEDKIKEVEKENENILTRKFK